MQNTFMVCIVICVSGCSGDSSSEYADISDRSVAPTKIPAEADQALEQIDRLELFALNPDLGKLDSVKQGFAGWNLLGTALITDKITQTKLVSVFKAGVEENDGSGSACFRPRHGIRIHSENTIHDFVISFDCSQVQWFVNQDNPKSFRITETPRAVFDEVLKEKKVRVPRQP